MKKLLFLLCFLSFICMTAQNRSKYSLEFSSQGNISYFNPFKSIEKSLKSAEKPYLSEYNTIYLNHPSYDFVFRINKWGIMSGNSFMYIETKPNADQYYYNGGIKMFYIGVMYDIVQNKWFTLSPYVAMGNRQTNLYLDYKLKEGVTPTSLHILGSDRTVYMGCKTYFRVKSWKDNKWELFVNFDGSYQFFTPLKWRFDNQLVKTENKNNAAINASIGATIRYYF